MADLELLYYDHEGGQPDHTNSIPWASNYQITNNISYFGEKSLSNEHRCDSESWESTRGDSAPWTAASQDGQFGAVTQWGLDSEITVFCEDELETSFTCNDGNVNLHETSPQQSTGSNNGSLSRSSSSEPHEGVPELSLLSDDELTSEASGKSVDYGFISAVTCLVTGILLVAISYTVPRDVKVERDSVSAREMERLERENARVGGHLDRCVIAGLCLLTLGGVVLSTLLMVSMWKGEMFRRKAFAYSKQSAKLYGSINLRGGSSPTRLPSHLCIDDEDFEVLS